MRDIKFWLQIIAYVVAVMLAYIIIREDIVRINEKVLALETRKTDLINRLTRIEDKLDRVIENK